MSKTVECPKCGEPMDVPAYPGDGVYKHHECPVNRILQARKWGLNVEDLDV